MVSAVGGASTFLLQERRFSPGPFQFKETGADRGFRSEGKSAVESRRKIVVGIIPQQNDAVIERAKRLAGLLAGDIVFVYADPSGYAGEGPHAAALDPDIIDGGSRREVSDEELEARLGRVMGGSDVAWRYLHVEGGAGQALARIAQDVDAEFIVIGDREPGPKALVREVVGGRVAALLVRSQSRPVVIVPQHPRREDSEGPAA